MLTRRYNRFDGRPARAFFLPHDVRASRDATPSTHIAPGVSDRKMHRGPASCAKLGHVVNRGVSLFPAKCPSKRTCEFGVILRLGEAHTARSIPNQAMFWPRKSRSNGLCRVKLWLSIFVKSHRYVADRIQMQNFCHATRNVRRDAPIVADAMQQLSHE